MIDPNPYPFGSGPPSEPEPASATGLDSLLANAGYRVRSADLRHVAASLELLDSATLGGGPTPLDGGVHYNPSDLSSWVDSMLDLHHPSSPPPNPPPSTWTAQIPPPHLIHPQFQDEEDTGIRLVHLLMSTADAVQRGDSPLAASLISDMGLLLTRVNSCFGIGKVAGYFVDALARRLYGNFHESQSEFEILYQHFYESSPFLKFAHFTANQAILEAFDGHDRVHVVDFNLMHGLQWPALIQALALRPGGPPFLRITGIGPPSPDGRDSLREVGIRLAELARSVHVRFAFRGVAANRLDDVKPWMLQVATGEAVAVNSVLQLHKLVGDADAAAVEPIETVLNWIAGLKPKIVTVVEQEADHNKPAFLDRFTEALFYYSTVFDALEMGRGQQSNSTALAEVYLQREICNIVCCEGPSRVERHEPLTKWRARLSRVGLRPVHLGSNAYKQASMLLTLFSGEGYGVDEVDGCLTLGWHNRPLISASAWRAATGDDDGVEIGNNNYNCNYNYNYNHNHNHNHNINGGSSSSSGSNNSSNSNVKVNNSGKLQPGQCIGHM